MIKQSLRRFGLPFLSLTWLASTAFAQQLVPGTFEAEDFDQGGEGPGYHENTPGNQGDAGFRTGEDVDIFVSNDPAGGGRIIKNFEAGEWLAYTISVPAADSYNVEVRAATNSAFPNSAYYVQVDGTNVTGTIVLPDTGGWDQYQWLGKRTIALTAGTHLLRIVSVTPYFALNSIRISSKVASSPYFGTPTAVPGEFEAEAFDRGGEGVAYHDTTPGNQGDSGLRDGEDVDISVSDDTGSGSPYIVYSMQAGEWLAYTVSVSTAGNYDIELRAEAYSVGGPTAMYHVEVDGTNATGTVGLGVTGNPGNYFYSWIGRATIALTAGAHTLKLVMENPYVNLNSIRITATGSSTATPRAIPGVIEAESFDAGGEGAGYHDNTPGNQGDAGFRTGEDVDIFNATDIQLSEHTQIVKNFEAGEWLAYTINAPDGGSYDIELRASTRFDFPDPAYHIEIDGTNVTGTVVLPDTGGWEVYQWLGKRTVTLAPGTHKLKLVSERPYFALNAIRVNPPVASQPYRGTPVAVPASIRAENYDLGGQGVAYHDNSPGNQGDAALRPGDDVDLFASFDPTSSSEYLIKNFEAGEWLAYSISVPGNNYYDIAIWASTSFYFPRAAYHIEVDGVNRTGTIELPDTGGWDNYASLGKRTLLLTGGPHVLKLVSERPYFGLRWIQVSYTNP